jgi:hypothetical protein
MVAVAIAVTNALSKYHVYNVLLPVAFLVVVTVSAALAVRKVWRGGDTVRGVLLRRRQRDRERLGTAGLLRAKAPHAAGAVAFASFFAAILALVAAPMHTNVVNLPPETDARWQLCCIAVVLACAAAGLDFWYGLGTCVRALAADWFTAAAVGITAALAAVPSLMIFWRVESRPAWLGVIAVQLCWAFGGAILCAIVSARRVKRLAPPVPAPAASSGSGFADGAWVEE